MYHILQHANTHRHLEKYYDPTVEVVVDTGVVTVKRGEYMTIFQKEEVPEENE